MSGIMADIIANVPPVRRYVTTAPGGITKIADGNPQRWAIGFFAAAGNPIVDIGGDSTIGLGITIASTGVEWFKMNDNGGLAAQEWWDKTAVGAITIGIIEILIPRGA